MFAIVDGKFIKVKSLKIKKETNLLIVNDDRDLYLYICELDGNQVKTLLYLSEGLTNVEEKSNYKNFLFKSMGDCVNNNCKPGTEYCLQYLKNSEKDIIFDVDKIKHLQVLDLDSIAYGFPKNIHDTSPDEFIYYMSSEEEAYTIKPEKTLHKLFCTWLYLGFQADSYHYKLHLYIGPTGTFYFCVKDILRIFGIEDYSLDFIANYTDIVYFSDYKDIIYFYGVPKTPGKEILRMDYKGISFRLVLSMLDDIEKYMIELQSCSPKYEILERPRLEDIKRFREWLLGYDKPFMRLNYNYSKKEALYAK